MNDFRIHGYDEEFVKGYDTDNFQLRVRHLKIGLILAIVLILVFSSLDWIVYPEWFFLFLWLRVGLDLLLCLILYGLHTQFNIYVVHLGIASILLMSVTFCIMIFLTDGMASPYYAGMNLALFMTSVTLPWTVKEAVIAISASAIMYICTCLFRAKLSGIDYNWTLFCNNLYFLLSTGVICVISCYFQTKRRFELFHLTYELGLKNKQLATLDELKSNFFANISHELRTPLTLILSPVQDLLQSSIALPDKVAEVLGYVRGNGLRLLKLVNNLLEIIRLEEGKIVLEKQPLDIIELAKSSIETMSHLAMVQSVELIDQLPDCSMTVLGNHAALEKVFFNLLNNSIKFTPQGGSITVTAHRTEQHLTISIRDTGIGITPDAIPHIFDKFHQADGSATRKHQGSGLGLALVKDLVNKHDGEIRVSSQVNAGTEMTIVLPAFDENLLRNGPVSEHAPADHVGHDDLLSQLYLAAEQSGGLAQPLPKHLEDLDTRNEYGNGGEQAVQLILVDDEPDMRRYLASLLGQDWNTLQTNNGEDAWELIQQHRPPLAILDVMMPGIDGLTLCKKIKETPETCLTKVVLLTARADEQAKLEALTYGADDFLTKPFSSLEIKTRLKNLMENHQLQNQLSQRNTALSETLVELKKTQEELIHSEKINSLGMMAAGLMHEINNPVNFVLMAIGDVKNNYPMPPDSDLKEVVTDIEDGIKRIGRIVSDLRTFAYPSEAENKKRFHCRQALDHALRFTAHERNVVNVKLEIHQSGDDEVMGSEMHIVQVFINVLSNAYKAIKPLCGTREGKVSIGIEPVNAFIQISVKDNGAGIEEAQLKHIFNPFFTTSEPGEGTGLGLSICHTIIQNHGGNIHADSVAGQWTEFIIKLPKAQ